MEQLRRYFSEVFAEIRKIVWPTRTELVGSAIIVCLLAIFFALVLGAQDALFGFIIRSIIG